MLHMAQVLGTAFQEFRRDRRALVASSPGTSRSTTLSRQTSGTLTGVCTVAMSYTKNARDIVVNVSRKSWQDRHTQWVYYAYTTRVVRTYFTLKATLY